MKTNLMELKNSNEIFPHLFLNFRVICSLKSTPKEVIRIHPTIDERKELQNQNLECFTHVEFKQYRQTFWAANRA